MRKEVILVSCCMGLISLGSEMRSCGVVRGHVLMTVGCHSLSCILSHYRDSI